MFKTNQIHLATSSISLSFKDKNGIDQERSIPILGLGTVDTPRTVGSDDGILVVECPFSFAAGDESTEHDWHAILTNKPPADVVIESDSDDELAVAVEQKEEKQTQKQEQAEDQPSWMAIIKYKFDEEDTLSYQPGKVNPNAGLSVDEVVHISNQHGALRNQIDVLYYRTKGLLSQKSGGKEKEKKKTEAQKACVEDLHRWAEKKKQPCQWSINVLTKISDFLKKVYDELTSSWQSIGPGGRFFINGDDLPENENEKKQIDLFDDSEERKKVGFAQFKGHRLHGWLFGRYSTNSSIQCIGIYYKEDVKRKVYVWKDEQLVCMELYEMRKKTERVEFFVGSDYEVNSEDYKRASPATRVEMDDIRKSQNPIIKRVIRYLQPDRKEEKDMKKPVLVVEFSILGDLLFIGEGVEEKEGEKYIISRNEEKGMMFNYVKLLVDENMPEMKYDYMCYSKVIEVRTGKKYEMINNMYKGKKIPNKGVIDGGQAVKIGGYYHLQWVEYKAGTMEDKSILQQTDYFTLFGFLKCSVITNTDEMVITERYTQYSGKPFMFTISSGENIMIKSFQVLKDDENILKLKV